MSVKYTEYVKNKAVELYISGMPAVEVATEIGANEATVRNWLKIRGIDIKNGSVYSKKYNIQLVNEIAELYKNGMNTPTIDKYLGLKRGISSYLLRKYDFELKHKGPKSKIGIEDYFDNIDSEEKAYYLGWIMADGNVSIYNGQYSLKIHIAFKDKELIDNFLEAIKSTNKTKYKKGDNESYYVSLTSRHLCEALIDLGVTPQKTGREIFPKQIPINLRNHFIRGVFDGDGITDISRKRSGFVSSYSLINDILKETGLLNKVTVFNVKRSESIYYFLIGKKKSRDLYSYMYNNANLYLTRKKERMEYICQI